MLEQIVAIPATLYFPTSIRSKGSEAPVILISGYDGSADTLRAEKLRIFDSLKKPFSRETICDAVKKAIGSQKGASA
jgi:DNA-binding NtrC family response regulator